MASKRATSWSQVERRCVVAAVALYAALLALTIPDYGPSWDIWEYYVGDHYFYFYKSLDFNYLDFRADTIPVYHQAGHPDFYQATMALQGNDVLERPMLIWPLGAAGAAASKWLFFTQLHLYDPLDAGNLILVLFAVVLVVALWRFARRHWGRWAAVTALLVVTTYPRLWADLHNNYKDPPTAVWFALTIITFVAGLRQHRWGWLLLSAVCWGLGLATKANGVFLPFILGPWFALVLWRRWRARERVLGRGEVIVLAAYPVIGLGLMFLLWPMLLMNFPHNLQTFVASLSSRGLHAGTGWNWIPLQNALYTMPLAVLALLLGGLAVIAARTWRQRRLADLDLLALLWMVVPVLRVTIPGAVDFDGIRHWLEFVPGLALVAGNGGGALGDWLAVRGRRLMPAARRGLVPVLVLAVLVLCFVPTIVWEVRNHPYELVYFNRLIGGLGGAQARQWPDATDYWASSYRQGYAWLYDHAEPGSLVYFGAAEHLGVYTYTLYLRHDLVLSSINDRNVEQIRAEVAAHPGSVYLMYVTRAPLYHALVPASEPSSPVAYELRVDGGVILKILRLK